jgi:sugar/nucleoside kinase (ribokinase family)
MNKIITFVLFLVFTLPTTFAADIEKPLHFVAVSNFICDHIYETPNSFITDQNFKKGDTTLINAAQAKDLESDISASKLPILLTNPGGSAANTAIGAKILGLDVGVIGTLTKDPQGNGYVSNLVKKGIEYRITPPQEQERGSGTCWIFVTETEKMASDGLVSKEKERTMLTSLGVSGDIRVSQENIDWASTARILLIEGYLFSPPTTYESICNIAKATKENNNMVALTLSAEFCVTRNQHEITKFIQEYADIVIGNNNEVQKLTDASNNYQAVLRLKSMAKKGAVTCGPEGAYVFDAAGIYFISSPAVAQEAIIDTTGAGDQFAAGFLCELLQSNNIIRAGQLGAYCAGDVIQVLGGHPSEELARGVASGAPWEILHREIHE